MDLGSIIGQVEHFILVNTKKINFMALEPSNGRMVFHVQENSIKISLLVSVLQFQLFSNQNNLQMKLTSYILTSRKWLNKISALPLWRKIIEDMDKFCGSVEYVPKQEKNVFVKYARIVTFKNSLITNSIVAGSFVWSVVTATNTVKNVFMELFPKINSWKIFMFRLD